MKTLLLPLRKKTLRFLIAALLCATLPACASRSNFQKGYERGAADTVKRQYWILQGMQKRTAPATDRRLALYRVPVEPDPNATVNRVPYEITIPIYE